MKQKEVYINFNKDIALPEDAVSSLIENFKPQAYFKKYKDSRTKCSFLFADKEAYKKEKEVVDMIEYYRELMKNYLYFTLVNTSVYSHTEGYKDLRDLYDSLDYIPLVYIPPEVDKMLYFDKSGQVGEMYITSTVRNYLKQKGIYYIQVPIKTLDKNTARHNINLENKDLFVTVEAMEQLTGLSRYEIVNNTGIINPDVIVDTVLKIVKGEL